MALPVTSCEMISVSNPVAFVTTTLHFVCGWIIAWNTLGDEFHYAFMFENENFLLCSLVFTAIFYFIWIYDAFCAFVLTLFSSVCPYVYCAIKYTKCKDGGGRRSENTNARFVVETLPNVKMSWYWGVNEFNYEGLIFELGASISQIIYQLLTPLCSVPYPAMVHQHTFLTPDATRWVLISLKPLFACVSL